MSAPALRGRAGRPAHTLRALCAGDPPAGRAVYAVYGQWPGEPGGRSSLPRADRLRRLTAKEVQDCSQHLCRDSVFAYEEELRQALFHRTAAAAGWAWRAAGGRAAYSAVTSLNLRIARPITCGLPPEVPAFLQKNTGGLLVAGPPGGAKKQRSCARSSAISAKKMPLSASSTSGVSYWPGRAMALPPGRMCPAMSTPAFPRRRPSAWHCAA